MTLEKRPDAFRTISEVAEELDLPQHVLRFWETRFSQIKPLKRGGGRRYYRPEDLDLLRGIRHLLYGQGFTIKGVQRILKEQGVHYVMAVWRSPADPDAVSAPAAVFAEGEDDNGEEHGDDGAQWTADQDDVDHPAAGEPHDEMSAAPQGGAPMASRKPPQSSAPADRDLFAQRQAREAEASALDLARRLAPPVAPARRDEPTEDPLPSGILPEDAPARSGFRFMERLRGGGGGEGPATGNLSREDIRRLQSTLFELLECKRVLDQTR